MKSIARKTLKSSLGLILTVAASVSTHAQTLDASANISGVALGNGLYSYTITLINASDSTVAIDAFWYSGGIEGNTWGYLPSAPTDISQPAGWTSTVTYFPLSGLGYGIDFEGSNLHGSSYAPIAPGSSGVFSFESPDSPSVLNGSTTAAPGGFNDDTPTGTPNQLSDVWSGVPTSGFMTVSELIVPQGVPEPSSIALVTVGGFAFIVMRRIKTHGSAREGRRQAQAIKAPF
jgi:hypothetical protein